ILGIHTSILARNCLVSNCGNNVVLGYGGDYQFLQCSLAGFSNSYIQHKQPVLTISNYVLQGTTAMIGNLAGRFTNCIFWGDNGTVDDEVLVFRQGDSAFQISFDHCLWKANKIPDAVDTSKIILNSDPLFEFVDNQQRIYNFHLKTGSPAIDAGTDSLGILIDLDGNPRPVGLADLGAYEKQ
ncbi:MAG TPA: choice-of-anchor Q domain-containing protein, partial [Puia sp.]|nr:choice-of-anchor Q domain-containing protein [Puia sp.]